jgi:hypothetical protein
MKTPKVIILIIVSSCLTALAVSYYLDKIHDRYQIVSPFGEKNIVYRLDKRTGKIDVLERGSYSEEFIGQREYKELQKSVEKRIAEAREKRKREFWDWQERRAKRLGRPFVFKDSIDLWFEWELEKERNSKRQEKPD